MGSTVYTGQDSSRVVFADDGVRFEMNEYLAGEPEKPAVGGLGIKLIMGLMDETAYAWQGGKNINSVTRYYKPE